MRACDSFLLAALLVLGFGAPAEAAPANPQIPGLEAAARVIDAEAAGHPNGSMTVAIVVRGHLVWIRSYGFADPERRIRATPDTVYRIGSITKQFTGLALLRLVSDGRARLDDPIIRYVPEARPALGPGAATIDLLALATHRAGLAREPNDPQNIYSVGPIDQWQRLAREALAHTQSLFPANERGRYSNIGYATLGLAIERASGVPYVDYVENRIVRPLGLRSTTFRPDAAMLARLAVGYRSSRTAEVAQARAELANGRGFRIPNGGLFSTAPDLARFMAFEMGGVSHGPVGSRTLRENFARSFAMSGGGRYGVGFTIAAYGERRLVGHNGLTPGYVSGAYFDPETRIGIVCLASAEDMCRSRFIEAYAALSPAWAPEVARMRAARAAIEVRVAAQRPYPRGEQVLRDFVASLAAGTPDYSRLSPVHGDLVRDNLAFLRSELVPLGALQSVTFQRVDAGGADVYETRFANGALIWALTFDEAGILETANMRSVQ